VRYEDAANREIRTTYAAPAPTLTGATLAQVANAADGLENTSIDQSAVTLFDAAGREQRVTDVYGNYEEFQYDDLGNKTSFRNELGAVWNYEYDANGRMIYERSPSVQVTRLLASGSSLSIDPSSAAASIVTRIQYDALGNVRYRTEAYGTGQARTTEYQYDALGRQTKTIFPPANIYNAATGDLALGNGGAIVRLETTDAAPYSEVTYDTLGNAFRSRDVAGGYSHKTYDNLGRVDYEVDAEGYATRYTYDAFGNERTLTRYARTLTATLSQTGTSLASETVRALIVEQPTADRTIEREYDRLNRVIKVTQPSVFNFIPAVGAPDGATFTAGPSTVYEYDAFGEVQRSRELVNATNSSYADTYFYYDRRGLKTAEVNALGFLSEYTYDETGDLTRQVEYARPLTSTPTILGYGTPPITTASTHPDGHDAGYDRDTSFGYDRLNRKISETRIGVRFTTIINGVPTPTTGNQVTTFGYDAVGNQTRVSQIGVNVNGVITDTHLYTYFDALGRTIAIAEPARSGGNATSLVPLTYMYRDAFGNLVAETKFANGADSVPSNGSLPLPDLLDAAHDRTTLLLLDKYGRAIQTQDATGANRFASYDARGQVAKEWQAVTNDGVTDYLTTIYKYDRLGQQTHVIEPQRYNGATTVSVNRQTDYNAFGEVIYKGIVDAVGQSGREEFFEYDQSGRLWRTNGGDGVTKVHLHDLLGNVTAEIRSQGRNLASTTYTNAAAVEALASDVMRTETRYDVLGRVLERRSPTFETTGGMQPIDATFDIANNVAGPINPHAIYQLVTLDFGSGPFQMYVVNPTATLAEGGGYYIDELGHYAQDPNHQITSSVRITWAAPTDASVEAKFEYRLLGSTDPNAWATIPVGALAGNRFGVDVASLAGQQYEYRVSYRRRSETSPYAQATGSFQVQGTTSTTLSISQAPADPAANIPALNSSYSNGIMAWAAPGDTSVTATVRVQRGGQGNFVDVVATRQSGNLQANLGEALEIAGNYRYEIIYTRTVNGATTIIAKSAGDLYSGGTTTPRVVTNTYFDDQTFVFPPDAVPTPTTQVGSSIGAVVVETERDNPPPVPTLPPANPNVHQYRPIQWAGQNVVQLQWGNLGAGNFRVEVDYVSEPYRRLEWVAQDVSWQHVDYSGSSTTTGPMAATGTGATLSWSSADNDSTGGVDHITAVRVYKETSPGVWTLQVQQANPTPVYGRGLTWAAPSGVESFNIVPTFEYALQGTGNYQPLPVTPSGTTLGVSLTSIPPNTYDYRITYRIGGRTTAQQIGTLFIQDASTTTSKSVTVTPGGPAGIASPVGTITGISGSANAVVNSFASGQEVAYFPSGATEPLYRWQGTNSVTVNYDALGAQEFMVEVQYYPRRSSTLVTRTSEIFNGATNPTSALYSWSALTAGVPEPNVAPGGVQSVYRVRLLGRDSSGNFTVQLRDTATLASGARLQLTDPNPATDVTAEYLSGSTWVPLQVLRGNGVTHVDVSALSGTYQYRIRHVRFGEDFAASTAQGTFSVSGGAATVHSQSNVVMSPLSGVTPSGSSVQWTQPPESGDTVRFEYYTGGNWVGQNVAWNGSAFSFNFQGFADTSYSYRIRYIRAGTIDAYRYAFGFVTVSSSTNNVPAVVSMTPSSTQTYPKTAITTAQMNGDTLSWNYPKQGGRVLLKYSLDNVYQEVEIAGSGPGFSYTFSQAAAGSHNLFYTIEYLSPNQTDPYAVANGQAQFTVAYPEIPATIAINSQAPEYPSGLQQLPAPTHSSGNVIGWSTPAEPNATVIFRYRSAAGGQWTELRVQGSYSVDLTSVAATAAGTVYAYEILYQRANASNPYARGAGTFTLTRNTNVTGVSISPVPPSQPTIVTHTPTQWQQMDRWGNALSVTDAAGNTTDYRYNYFDQVIQVENPEVLVTSTTDRLVDEERRRTVSRNHYDALGRLIATEDANGNLNRLELDAAGQSIREIRADGGTREHDYDIFGDVVATQTEVATGSAYETRYSYDRAGRLTAVSREVTANAFETSDTANIVIDSYGYDAAGRRITETNGENETTRYYYDLHDNVARRRSALNLNTYYEYDAQGNKTFERDGIDGVMTWSYDYFSRLASHEDLGGTDYTYSYAGNYAGLLQSQSSTANQAIGYEYDAAGQLTQINDAGVGRITDYSYDLAGRRAREKVRINSLTYQDTSIGYDEMNRISSLSDLRYDLTYSYDAQGNRTHIAATYYDHERHAQNQDLWYTYDAMNRVLISQGENAFGQVDISETQGTRLTYDLAGRRLSSEAYGAQKIRTEDVLLWNPQRLEFDEDYNRFFIEDYVLERYTYDGLDRLDQTYREGESYYFTRNDQNQIVQNYTEQKEYLISDRDYDKASREIFESTLSVESNQLVARQRSSSYDDDGRLGSQTTLKDDPLTVPVGFNNESIVSYHYNNANLLTSYDVAVYSSGPILEHLYTSHYTNNYLAREGYLDSGQSVHSTAYEGQAPESGYTTRGYNVNGELISFTDSENANNNRYFANNANGQALLVVQGDISNVNQAFANALSRADNANRSQYFFFANGQNVGSFGQLQNEAGEFEANFDVHYTPISAHYPSSAPASTVAQAGDTLRTIAARIFGDANLWYVLAEENGLTDPDALIDEGTIVRVPNEVVSLSNASGSFKPFDASTAIGDTTPTQPLPPPPRKDGCGVIGQILVIVVAIVVTWFTAGALSGAFTALGPTGSAIATGAVSAAAGSVASQGVAIAIGQQDSFSWKSVASAALSAGLTQGIGVSVPSFGPVADAAINSAVNQGVNIALGLQEKFNWSAVAAAAVSAPIANWAGNKIGGAVAALTNSPFVSQVASDFTSGMVDRIAYAKFTGGKLDYGDVAADAFGHALGNGLTGAAERYGEKRKVEQVLRKAGIDPATASEAMLRSAHALVRGDYSTDDIRTYFADERIQSGVFGGGARAEATIAGFSAADRETIHNGAADGPQLAAESIYIDPVTGQSITEVPVTASRTTAIDQFADGVLHPLMDAGAALGDFAERHERLAEMAVYGTQVALMGPAQFAKGMVIDTIVGAAVGDELAKINTYLHDKAATWLQDRVGFNAEESSFLAHGAVFAGQLIVESAGNVVGSAKNINNIVRDERGRFASDPNGPANDFVARERYIGSTPSKTSPTGRAVIERMQAQNRIRKNELGEEEFKSNDGNWYAMKDADMSHVEDVSKWWNREGRFTGAKSDKVREHQTNPDNYELEYFRHNRARGSSAPRYLPPVDPPGVLEHAAGR
jgi:YD repeat-containing protein